MRTLTSHQRPESLSPVPLPVADTAEPAARPEPAVPPAAPPSGPPASELLFSAPAVIRSEPVDGGDGTSAEPAGKEVITVGKKLRNTASYWKRTRNKNPNPGLPPSKDVAARHITPQHIMYIK